jgi:hypothetical protein
MDNIANLAFTLVVLLIVFAYDGYRDRKRAEVERALIEQGKADVVVELRRLRMQRLDWYRRPALPVALGVASIVSGGVLYLTGLGDRYGRVDVWFVILGIFAIAWGLAARLEER